MKEREQIDTYIYKSLQIDDIFTYLQTHTHTRKDERKGIIGNGIDNSSDVDDQKITKNAPLVSPMNPR